MPHQNRVDPFGNILAVPGRGMFMGNRGCIHREGRNHKKNGQAKGMGHLPTGVQGPTPADHDSGAIFGAILP